MSLQERKHQTIIQRINNQKADFNNDETQVVIEASLQDFAKLLARRAASIDYAKRESEDL